jgi:hypothetical protein
MGVSAVREATRHRACRRFAGDRPSHERERCRQQGEDHQEDREAAHGLEAITETFGCAIGFALAKNPR